MKKMAARERVVKLFQFKPGFSIGAVAAEQDRLLEYCFVTNSSYESIIDIDDPRCGVIGRAGSGKTAILYELKKSTQQIVEIDPETLAFQFLGSSEMIKALRASNVTLDYFYKLLWRHVFVVEILKCRFPDESKRYGLISQIIDHLKRTVKPDKERERAINYLDQWGATIIQAPQERIQIIHDTFAKRVRAKIGMIGGWSELMGVGAGAETNLEHKKEISERMQLVKQELNLIQVQDLNAVMKYLSTEIFNDPQKPMYVIIDDLDRFWVEDPLVYELIRALILEIYDWSDVNNIKIIYVIRDNILSKIESEFTSRSYQREKLEAQRTHLNWTRKQLTQIIDRRLEVLSEEMDVARYPTLNEILPRKRGKQPHAKDYILERTFYRPRDIIDYINKSAEQAIGNNSLSFKNIREAESLYSIARLEAICDEWLENCPGIDILARILVGSPPRFPPDWITEDDITRVFSNPKLPTFGWLHNLCNDFMKRYAENKSAALYYCRKEIIKILYEIGIIGIRRKGSGPIRYSYYSTPILKEDEFDLEIELFVHPMFHCALDISFNL